MIVNKTMFPLNRGFSTISNMHQTMENLQTQLATGKRANSLSELGSERVYDLSIRSRQSQLNAYKSSIQTVDLRLQAMDNVVSRLDEIEGNARSSSAAGSSGGDETGMVTAQSLSKARLDEVLTILGTEVNGRHLFGGNVTDKSPVATMDAILNGSEGKDGFRTVVSERKQADAGTDGLGRLDLASGGLEIARAADSVSLTEGNATDYPYRQTIDSVSATTTNAGAITVSGPAGTPPSADVQFGTNLTDGDTVTVDVTLPGGGTETRTLTAVAGAPSNPGEFQIDNTDATNTAANFQAALEEVTVSDTVTLAEDGDHPFGAKLSTPPADSDFLTVDFADGAAPKVLSMRFTGQPSDGDKVTIGVTLPDGSETTLEFSATAGTPTSNRQFQIGADPQETAANFQSSLESELEHMGETELEAASVYAAADDFFAGQGGTVRRVDGSTSFAEATGFLTNQISQDTTVQWYTGEDTPGRARDTVQAKVDDGTVVSYGTQANEEGIVNLVSSLAAMTVESYPDTDPNASERYNQMNQRQHTQLSEANNDNPGAIEVISLELGIAKSTIGQAKERHETTGAQLDTMLADIEEAPVEEVAMKLMSLQTRLQASYQTTAMVSQLTLVNYVN